VEPAEYPVEAAARSRQTFLLPAGPRTVREIRVLPAAGTEEAWRTARLRLTWEGDDTSNPGADVPLGLLFGRTGPGTSLGAKSHLTGDESGWWVVRFPMPYRKQALLEIETDRPLAGRLTVRSSRGVGADAGYFRAASWAVGSEGEPAAVLEEAGRGRLAGLVVLRGRSLPDGSLLGQLGLDGGAPEPLVKAFGLTPEAGSPAVFSWPVVGKLAYDHNLTLRGVRRVVAPSADGAGGGRLTVFWYADRPAAVAVR